MGGPGSGAKLSSVYSVELGFSFNINLGKNLEVWRDAVMNQDIDFVVLVDGKEGAGKSVLGMQVAVFLDKDRELDINKQICYYPDQVKEAIMTLPKFKAIVWDEARRGLNRRRSTQEVNLEMTDLIAECRQHNLFLVVIMPSFYDMDMNIAVWRSRALIHVWYDMQGEKGRPLRRGFFRFYTEAGKKYLYTSKRLRQNYAYPHLQNKSFDATFVNHYVVNEEEYRIRKRDAEEAFRSGKVISKFSTDPNRCPECGRAVVYFLKRKKKNKCQLGHEWNPEGSDIPRKSKTQRTKGERKGTNRK